MLESDEQLFSGYAKRFLRYSRPVSGPPRLGAGRRAICCRGKPVIHRLQGKILWAHHGRGPSPRAQGSQVCPTFTKRACGEGLGGKVGGTILKIPIFR